MRISNSFCAVLFVSALLFLFACHHSNGMSKREDQVVEISFVRSGGFAGPATRIQAKVNLDKPDGQVVSEPSKYNRQLTASESERLRHAARELSSGTPSFSTASPGAVRDGYQYDITINTKDGKTHTVSLQQNAPAPNTVSPDLVTWVQEEAERIWAHRIANRGK
jgi:hypothetical protein